MAAMLALREGLSQCWHAVKIILMIVFVLACAIVIFCWLVCLALCFFACFIFWQIREFLCWLGKAETWIAALEVVGLTGIIAFEVLLELAYNMMIVSVEVCLE